MLNTLFAVLVLLSVLVAAFSGRMEPVSQGALDAAKRAVELSLGLVGSMTLFMGLMRVAQDGGLLRMICRAAAPVMKRLFPEVPAEHPAMSAMVMSIGSNLLGLANAATPFGIRAMQELEVLNPVKGTASDSMVLFLVVTAAGLSILPSSVVALRAAAGSKDPAGIIVTTWVGSACATVVGIVAAKLLARTRRFRRSDPEPPTGAGEVAPGANPVAGDAAPAAAPALRPPRAGGWLASAYLGAVAIALGVDLVRTAPTAGWGGATRGVLSFWMIPLLIAGLVLFGWARGVKVYESLVEGGKEGFQVALRIIPYLVAILVAVAMFRASGCLDALVGLLAPVTEPLGLPSEVVPLALLRPLSGSGGFALLGDLLTARGPDSFVGYLASTIQGSTDTTFYILAVYFGAVGVRKTRHAVPAGLLADLAGVAAAVAVCHLAFGG